MSKVYKIVHGRIRLPRPIEEKQRDQKEGNTTARSKPRFLNVGDYVRADEWSEEDIRAWLEGGYIRPAGTVGSVEIAGPTAHDPSRLASMGTADLIEMVAEVDEEAAQEMAESDHAASEAIAFLSADFRPAGIGAGAAPALPAEGDLKARARGRS
jgi:hypothetical protein